ncbi:MAG TPA: transcription antitermination factor NusB [Bryobacteraceae bacterium]|nr:transcription antitermination factor NusB [Bryobacteraceae bacterium]
MSPARIAAFDVLLRVERGAHADDLLREHTRGLTSRDAALAYEIALGVLRRQAQLDFLIRHFSGRDPARLDPQVRIALRAGLYQLRFLNRVPAHAAVGESVDLVKRARKASAAALVNAVLRRASREMPPWPDRATELSMPTWLLERWDRFYGPDVAEKMARAALEPPETWVRFCGEHPPQGVVLEPTDIAGAWRLIAGDPAGLRIQDISSQSVVPLLELQPGLSFLDLCAAPGNKTAQALEYGVSAIACDISPLRLAPLQNLGCPRVVLDATRPLPFRRRFDRILLDVPCSGTGTLARNPEIKWRLRPEDLPNFHDRQVRMLRSALEALAPGGLLVYSTCSLEPEENEQVLEEVLGRLPERILRRLPGLVPGDGFFAAVIPST